MDGEITRKKGIVLMLDALGVRNLDMDKTEKFAGRICELKSDIDDVTGQLADTLKEGKVEMPLDNAYTFGDTVLICWEQDAPNDRALWGAASIAMFLMREALEREVMFRGVLSVGDYISSESTVLGPAVSEAAMWYELGNWIGVIVTPKTEMYVRKERENLISNGELDSFPGFKYGFIDYDVPLRIKDKDVIKKMIVVNWHHYWSQYLKLNDLLVAFSSQQIPLGSEDKYYNTIKFYDHCEKLKSQPGYMREE